jgi:hypothetical protein
MQTVVTHEIPAAYVSRPSQTVAAVVQSLDPQRIANLLLAIVVYGDLEFSEQETALDHLLKRKDLDWGSVLDCARDCEGKTLLDYACEHGHLEVVEKVLRHCWVGDDDTIQQRVLLSLLQQCNDCYDGLELYGPMVGCAVMLVAGALVTVDAALQFGWMGALGLSLAPGMQIAIGIALVAVVLAALVCVLIYLYLPQAKRLKQKKENRTALASVFFEHRPASNLKKLLQDGVCSNQWSPDALCQYVSYTRNHGKGLQLKRPIKYDSSIIALLNAIDGSWDQGLLVNIMSQLSDDKQKFQRFLDNEEGKPDIPWGYAQAVIATILVAAAIAALVTASCGAAGVPLFALMATHPLALSCLSGVLVALAAVSMVHARENFRGSRAYNERQHWADLFKPAAGLPSWDEQCIQSKVDGLKAAPPGTSLRAFLAN